MRGSSWAKLPFLLWVACGDELAPVDAATGDAAVRDADAGDAAARDGGVVSADAGCNAGDLPVFGARVDEQRQCIAESAQVGCEAGPEHGCGDSMTYGRDADGLLWMFPDTCQPREVVSESIELSSYPQCDELTDGASLGLTATIEGEWIKLASDSTRPLYGRLCGGAVALSRERDGKWTDVSREPSSGLAPYLLNGVSTPRETCADNPCLPLDGQRVSRNEVVPELSGYGTPAAGSEDRFSTRLVSAPMRLHLSVYDNAQCAYESRHSVNVAVSAPALAPAPLPTTIRVTNQSGAVRSRHAGSCGGSTLMAVPVRRVAAESTYMPNCPSSCVGVPPATELPTGIACPAPLPCVGPRIDLAPGETGRDYVYDGVFGQFTDQNCVEQLPLERGTPMLARVCYGTPGPADMYTVAGETCKDVPFAYGQATLDITLD